MVQRFIANAVAIGGGKLTREERRKYILNAAVDLAISEGYLTLSRGSIAAHAGISPALITFYFYKYDLLLDEVMQEAVRRGIPSIIAEGLAGKHPHALAAPLTLRQEAVDHLSAWSLA